MRLRQPNGGRPYVALCPSHGSAKEPGGWGELTRCGGCGRGMRRPEGSPSRVDDGCSRECRAAVRAARLRRERTPTVRTCERMGCSRTFKPVRVGHRYCSKRCADAAGESRRRVKSEPAPAPSLCVKLKIEQRRVVKVGMDQPCANCRVRERAPDREWCRACGEFAADRERMLRTGVDPFDWERCGSLEDLVAAA